MGRENFLTNNIVVLTPTDCFKISSNCQSRIILKFVRPFIVIRVPFLWATSIICPGMQPQDTNTGLLSIYGSGLFSGLFYFAPILAFIFWDWSYFVCLCFGQYFPNLVSNFRLNFG